MKGLGRLGAIALIAASASVACVSGASADVILTYTGQDFTHVQSPYTTSDKVTGTLDLSAPLGDNLSDTPVTPVSFSFSDGVQTLTGPKVGTSASFNFWTNSSGVITAWSFDIEINNTVAMPVIGAVGGQIGGQIIKSGDSGIFLDNNTDELVGGSNGLAGSWSVQAASVPEPLTLSLFGAGLVGAVAMRRRRKAA